MPALVGRALLGADLPPSGLVVARCMGLALIALALAVWPDRGRATGAPAHWRDAAVAGRGAACRAVAVLLALPLLGVQDEA
jgi:hypothetical protein